MSLSEREIVARLKDNVARVRERMAAAAARAGREHGARLIAVTKYVEPEIARLLVTECGVTELAESRPQELWRKAEALADISVRWPSFVYHRPPAAGTACWHLIGHLQQNKLKRTLPLISCIHSVDSLRLLGGIDCETTVRELGTCDTLIEVNVSGDETKHGIRPPELASFLEEATYPTTYIVGLMTMASLEGGPDQARRDFAALRNILERFPERYAPTIELTELSMGMSADYEIAIEEGATMVRVGSALFEGIV